MTQTARSRLLDIYGTDPGEGRRDTARCRRQPSYRIIGRRAGRPVVLTWGLLGPGKGIEHAIDSMALLRDRGLHVDYQVAGQTHPRVLDRDGEAYRRALKARARDRDVADRVHFDGRFLPAAAFGQLISAADVVLLPYDSLEQVTSGVLIEAVTAGKPVVSTCFPHAVELLGAGTPGRPAGPGRHRARAAARADRARPLGADEQVLGGPRAAAAVASGRALLPGTRLAAHRTRAGARHELPGRAVPAPAAPDRPRRLARARRGHRAQVRARLLRRRRGPRPGRGVPGTVASPGTDHPGAPLPLLPGPGPGARRKVP